MDEVNNFLELIEQIDAREAISGEVWTRDDPQINRAISSTIARRRRNRHYERAFMEAVRLIDRVREGSLPDHWLREAMSTNDFATLFGDVLDRQMLGVYAEYPTTWRNYIRTGTVRDFRTVNRFVMDGGEAVLLEVKELGEYKAANLTPSKYSWSIKKYGRRMPFSFETMINDDMAALTDTPARFARAARRSEAKYATGLYAGSTGPLGTLYTSGNKNIINTTNGASATNPPLSIAGLQDGFTVLSAMKDTDGEPIMITAVELVVPPALEQVALNIVNALQIEAVDLGGTSNRKLIVNNWMKNRVRVNVDPYLPVVSTTNGATSWYLFASVSTDRPALEIDFLRGYEAPQIFMKSPNAVRVGGGNVDPMQGDFDSDLIDYKVRHMFGGGTIDPKATVASNGTGS